MFAGLDVRLLGGWGKKQKHIPTKRLVTFHGDESTIKSNP